MSRNRNFSMLALAAVAAAITLLWVAFGGPQIHANDGKATLNSCSANSIAQPGNVNAIATATNVSADDQGRGAASMYVAFTVTGGDGSSTYRESSSRDIKVGVTEQFDVIGIHVPDSGSYMLTCEVFTTVDGLPSLGDTSTSTFTVGSQDATPTPTPTATPTPTHYGTPNPTPTGTLTPTPTGTPTPTPTPTPNQPSGSLATLNSCRVVPIAQPGDVTAIATATNVSADDQGRGAASMYVEFTVSGEDGYSAFRVSPAGDIKVGVTGGFDVTGIHIPDSGNYTLTCEVFVTVDGLPTLGDTGTSTFTVGGPTPTPTGTPTPTPIPADDHGNTRASATAMSVNSHAAGVIEKAGDQDYFSFYAESDSTYSVTTSSTSGLDTELWVYGPDGNQLTYNNDDDDGGVTSAAEFAATKTGTHYVRVGESGNDATGTYDLMVDTASAPPTGDDHGNDLTTATIILSNLPKSGRIESTSDADYFAFPANSGATYTVSVASSAINAALTLYNRDGIQLTYNVAGDSGSVSHQFKAKQQDTYYIRVADGGNDATGAYTVKVNQDARPSEKDDHGNTREKATLISVNSPTAGKIAVAGDVDYFRFTAESGVTYSVSTTSSDFLDTELYVYDANGAEVGHNDDAGDGTTSAVTFTATQASDYYVLVLEHGNDAIGTYTLTVDAGSAPIADDHGNNRSDATAILLNSDAPGSIEKAGDVDYFSFYADQDATYSLIVTPESGFDAQLWLYGSEGALLRHNNNASAPGAAISGFKATQGGRHYVRVAAVGDAATGNYELTIKVDAAPPGDDRHGDTRDKATAITPNSPVAGKINVAGDVDYFVFPGQHGSDYHITVVSGDNLDTELALFDAGGNQLDYNDDAGPAQGVTSLINHRATTDGNLYVRVSEFGDNDTGSYTLTVDESSAPSGDDHGNELAASTTMSANSSELGNIEQAGDVDYFVFHADAGVTYTIDTFEAGAANTELTLYDKDGAQLAYENDRTTRGASITHRAAQAGALYIRVAGTGTINTGTYTLSVNADTTPVVDDHKNSASGATEIALNSSEAGKIEIAGDVDYFVFAATPATQYTISASSAGGLDTVLTLFSASGAQLDSDDDGGVGFGSLLTYRYTGTQVGNIYVRVNESGNDAIGGYTLSLAAGAAPPVGDDHGNEIPAATTMSVNSSENGNIEVIGDQDYFAFQAGAGVSYTIGAVSAVGLDTELWLYGSDGTRLAHDDNGGGGNNSRVKYRAARAGTLYAQVAEAGNDATGTYTLSVNADSAPLTDDHGNTRAKATSVSVNSDNDGNIEVAGDVDYFSFQAARGATYTVSAASSAGTDTELWLYDANGVQLAYDDDSGDGSAASYIKFKAKQAGKLYVRVAEYRNDGTGSYTLSVAVLDFKADLETTAVSVLPASPTVGQKITVNYTLRNNGAAVASNFTATLLIDDAVVATTPSLSLVGTGVSSGSFSSIWTCSAGRHVILISVDRNNQIDESKENNNEFTAAVNCRPASSS